MFSKKLRLRVLYNCVVSKWRSRLNGGSERREGMIYASLPLVLPLSLYFYLVLSSASRKREKAQAGKYTFTVGECSLCLWLCTSQTLKRNGGPTAHMRPDICVKLKHISGCDPHLEEHLFYTTARNSDLQSSSRIKIPESTDLCVGRD